MSFISMSNSNRKASVNHAPSIKSTTKPAMTEAQSFQFKVLLAIKNLDYNSLATLIQSNFSAVLNFVDAPSGLTPLQYATRLRPLKHPESELIIKKLILKGSNVNSQNSRSGKTPLHYILRVRKQ